MIGKGMTAEVYEWGSDKVVKLFFERFSEDWINYEASIGKVIHEAGVPSPAVFDIIELDGRKGIIFQRISGTSILSHLQIEPWNIYNYATQLAALHFRIHRYTAADLPSQEERFAVKINSSSKLLGHKEQRILNYIESLPDGTSVCHGDLHFNNIIVSDHKLVPIDWTSAYRGNPLGDVARTCLMMSSPAKPEGASDLIMLLSQSIRWLTYWTYVNEYIRLAKIRFEDIDAWILPVAAAKLRDKIPGEEKWLMNLISKRINQLDN